MKKNRIVWLALISLILFSMACNLSGGTASDTIEDQIGDVIGDQVQQALEDSGGGELIEDFGEVIEDFSEGNWTREDIPLPPDSEVFGASVGEIEGDLVLFETSMSLEEAEAWISGKLKDNGWSQGDTEMSIDQTRVLEFSKGDEGLSLVMTGNIESGGTSISITVFPLE